VRISMGAGDMIVLPAGMYHRFTLDEGNYLKAMRLFVGAPIWTPYNTAEEGTWALEARAKYVEGLKATAATA